MNCTRRWMASKRSVQLFSFTKWKKEHSKSIFNSFFFQLCELLKIKEKVPYTLPTPVEAALEANEAAVTPKRKSIDKKLKSNERIRVKMEQQSLTMDESPPKLVRVPAGALPPLQISPSKQTKFKPQQHHQPIEVRGDDFEYIGNADLEESTGAISKIRYELPENILSRTAALILGNRKELEMHEFSSSKSNSPQHSIGSHDGNKKNLPEIDPSGDRQPSIE